MSRIIFPHGNVGEAKSYIKSLTGDDVSIPNAPTSDQIGQVIKVESKYLSVNAAASVGFGFGSVNGKVQTRVLLQDYWFLKEIQDNSNDAVNSWTFAVGFRVGLKIVGFKANMQVGIGSLAVKAETEGLNVQLQILQVGMPSGPIIPVNLAIPNSLDVDKFGELKAWEGTVLNYVKDNKNDLSPVLVSASVNIDGDKLLNETPGVRFALWRIKQGKKLKEALALLDAGFAPEVDKNNVRTAYSSIFGDPTMIIPGSPSENKGPLKPQIELAKEWLEGYKRI